MKKRAKEMCLTDVYTSTPFIWVDCDIHLYNRNLTEHNKYDNYDTIPWWLCRYYCLNVTYNMIEDVLMVILNVDTLDCEPL